MDARWQCKDEMRCPHSVKPCAPQCQKETGLDCAVLAGEDFAVCSVSAAQRACGRGEADLLQKDKLLLKMSFALDILIAGHTVKIIHLFRDCITKVVSKGWG